MCGGAILSGFIRPSGPAAKKQQQQLLLQHQPRRVTADLLWPGAGRKGAPVGDDFEADFREFVRGLGEGDGAGDVGDDDEVVEVPPPEPAMFSFAAAAKAAAPAVGENRIKVATSFCLFCFLLCWRTLRLDTAGREKDASFGGLWLLSSMELQPHRLYGCKQDRNSISWLLMQRLDELLS